MKKEALVAGVLLSIFSMGMSAQAATYSKIDINMDKEIHYRTSTFSGVSTSITEGAITAPDLMNDNDLGITLNIIGNNDKNINFICDGTDTGVDEDSAALLINYNTGFGNSVGVLNNSGDAHVYIKSDRKVYINNNIYMGHSSSEAIKSQYGIKNEAGYLNIQADLNICLDSRIAKSVGIRNEHGAKLDIIGNVFVDAEPLNSNYTGSLIENEGDMRIDNGDVILRDGRNVYGDTQYTAGYNAISNKGSFILNSDYLPGQYYIYGDIEHFSGAKTTINLIGDSTSVNSAHVLEGAFWGAIKGSDENFKMTLGDYSFWSMPKEQADTVYGLNIEGGFVYVNTPNYYNYSSSDTWNTDYKTVTFANLKTNGQGGICVSTDLINNIGDKVILTGEIPDKLQLGIKNKDDNGGIPIKDTDGYSVTVLHVDGNKRVDLKTGLMFYNLETTDGVSSLDLISPVIKEQEIFSGNITTGRDYNFVGWEANETGNILDKTLPKNEPYIVANEIDNTFKRLMDIRNDPSEVGVWIRGEAGEMKIDGYGFDYNLMSGGHDWQHESNAAYMFGGFAVSHSVNKCDTGIIGDTKGSSYSLYGSWLGKDNNDYLDLIIKYGNIDKNYTGLDINNVLASGSYSKDVFSIAAKYGRRYEMQSNWYYEPFAGLTWGRISDVDFKDSRGFNIHGDSITSKIGSLGIQVGKKVDIKRDFYYRMNLMHDFGGKMHVNVPGTTTAAYTDMGGTWLKFAIGTSAKMDKNNSYYIDLEKDFGNNVEKPWAISAGYRYTW